MRVSTVPVLMMYHIKLEVWVQMQNKCAIFSTNSSILENSYLGGSYLLRKHRQAAHQNRSWGVDSKNNIAKIINNL